MLIPIDQRLRRAPSIPSQAIRMMSKVIAKHFDLSSLYDKPVIQKAKPTSKAPVAAQDIAATWIGDFDKSIRAKDASAVAALFQNDGSETCKRL